MNTLTKIEKAKKEYDVAREQYETTYEKLDRHRREFWEVVGPPTFNYWGLGFGGYTLLSVGSMWVIILVGMFFISNVFTLIGLCVSMFALALVYSRVVDRDVWMIKRWRRIKQDFLVNRPIGSR